MTINSRNLLSHFRPLFEPMEKLSKFMGEFQPGFFNENGLQPKRRELRRKLW